MFSIYLNEIDVMLNLIPRPDSSTLPVSIFSAIWFCSLPHSDSNSEINFTGQNKFDQCFGKDYVPFLNLDLKRPQMFPLVLLFVYHYSKRNMPRQPADSKRRMRSPWSWLTQPVTIAKNIQPHLPTDLWAKQMLIFVCHYFFF